MLLNEYHSWKSTRFAPGRVSVDAYRYGFAGPGRGFLNMGYMMHEFFTS
jgi:hypothetical protein